MKLIIDTDTRALIREEAGQSETIPLFSSEAFRLLSQQWLRVGWSQKYSYQFTWLGRPVVQLPEDLLLMQETIYRVRPDVIIETGVAHGGSLIFYATLCKALGRGRVIGIDIEIRPHNRSALEAHLLAEYVTLLEGSSIDGAVVSQVQELIRPGERVLVILDSCHSKDHVLAELRSYSSLVSVGSYIIVEDGIMQDLAAAGLGRPDWTWDNPLEAATQFVGEAQNFCFEEPPFLFNEGTVTERVTCWPRAFLRRAG